MTIGKKIANSIDGKTIGVVLLLAAVTLAGARPAAAACGGVKQAKPTRDRVPGNYRPPLAIGDSVMLGALDEMAYAGFEVNVRGCRQMSEGLNVIAARKHAGTLPRVVLMLLGANWVIEPGEISAALRLLGPDRVLTMLTPRESGGGSGADARVVRAAGRRHPERMVVLDWVAYGAAHPEWFGDDGLHLLPGGAAALARLSSEVVPLAAPPFEDDWAKAEVVPRFSGGFGPASGPG
jgi:hypothetical protein